MRALIFVNGPFAPTDLATREPGSEDLVIGADGGCVHCRQLGLVPDVVLGDFDSIPPELLRKYREEGCEILRHPPRKNATDLELALDLALVRGADDVEIFGALGGRWDMSFGNILTAASARYHRLQIRLHAGRTEITILRPGRRYILEGGVGQTYSLLPLGGAVSKVTMDGCEYPLKDHDIDFGSSLGLSNVFSASRVTIVFDAGILAFISETQAPAE